MKIIMSGARGFVGSALTLSLAAEGHLISELTRQRTDNVIPQIVWDPLSGSLEKDSLAGHDIVIHLAGESLLGRWNKAKKKAIYDSRIIGTALLSQTLAALPNPPKMLICASASGYYGNRDDETVTEESASGEGFLAQVCRDWEAATEAASLAGIRVVNLRFGIILSPMGGALAKMLPAFQSGLGGHIGNGRQYISWITLEEVVEIVKFVIANTAVQGAVNVSTPHPVSNKVFTKILGKVLSKATLAIIPAFAIRLVLGEAANETLLTSIRMQPKKLLDAGYEFRHPDLEAALRDLLGR